MDRAKRHRQLSERLAHAARPVQEFVTTRQGYRLATSTGGVPTGRGADIIAIDDPLKRRPPDTAQLPPVLDWQERLVCSQCGSREIDMVLPVLSGGA